MKKIIRGGNGNNRVEKKLKQTLDSPTSFLNILVVEGEKTIHKLYFEKNHKFINLIGVQIKFT